MSFTRNNGTRNTDYGLSIENRIADPGTGAFFNGAASGTSHADFDQAYDAINSYDQGSRARTYTVRGGDSLQGIAAGLYGDSSLWYKIAEVNGLSANSALNEGTSLIRESAKLGAWPAV